MVWFHPLDPTCGKDMQRCQAMPTILPKDIPQSDRRVMCRVVFFHSVFRNMLVLAVRILYLDSLCMIQLLFGVLRLMFLSYFFYVVWISPCAAYTEIRVLTPPIQLQANISQPC